MIALLKSRGYENASLSVNTDNYAYKMYRKLGFYVIQEQDEDDLMVLELQNRRPNEQNLFNEKTGAAVFAIEAWPAGGLQICWKRGRPFFCPAGGMYSV